MKKTTARRSAGLTLIALRAHYRGHLSPRVPMLLRRSARPFAALGLFALCTALFLAGLAGGWSAEPEKPRRPWNGEPGYCRFPGTISPDGAYLLAWAPSGLSPEVRASLKEWEPDLEINSDKIGIDNYLLDAAHGRLLAPLPNFDYFDGQGWHKNRGGLYVAWAPDSSSAVAICENRWEDDGVVWIEPAANRVTDIKDPLEKAYQKTLRQRDKERGDVNIQFSEPAILPGGILVLDGNAGHMKEGPYYHYRFTFRVRTAEGKPPQVELLKAKKINDKASPESPDADGLLNTAYGQLRTRLDAKGRTALKKEEEAWLQWRDAQPDTALDQLNIRRAAELRARAEN
jgi:hypothetical protein